MQSGSPKISSNSADAAQQWSPFSITCLLLYRLYSGFNSATWLPYLLAKEGEVLWSEDQALFMGIAKLIYGLTMLANPFCGLLGDKVVGISHGVGRRFFVRWGVTFAATGIVICVLSDVYHNFYWFMFGVFVWRVGEAMNDVTIEALAPEMLPVTQYALAGGIKAFLFMIGGVLGYVMLIVFADNEFTWVYVAYLIAMPVCILPAILLLSSDEPLANARVQRSSENTFFDNLHRAYIAPFSIPGGFPLASMSAFIFSLGTAPMFFLLLIVRDLLGVEQEGQQNRIFSYLSIVFFLAASLASVLATQEGRKAAENQDQNLERRNQETMAMKILRYERLRSAVIMFGAIALLFPVMVLFSSFWWRGVYAFGVALFYGFFFGSAYSRFQDCTWMLLPQGVDMASVMGFNVMCRNAGLGAGNFLAGLILECFVAGGSSWYKSLFESTSTEYSTAGYVWLCTLSGVAVFASSHTITLAAKEHFETGHGDQQPLQAS